MVRSAILVVAAVIACPAVAADAKAKAKAKEKDPSQLKEIRVLDKRPRLKFVLPKPAAEKKGAPRQEWTFRAVDAAKERELAVWNDMLGKIENALKEGEDPDKKIPEAQRKQLESNAVACRSIMQQIRKFFDGCMIVIEDPKDPDTSVFIAATEINREYALESEIAKRKAEPPPWRLARVENEKEKTIVTDKTNARFKPWIGWQLHIQYRERAITPDAKDLGTVHDMVYIYRKGLAKGGIFMLEVNCRWKDAPGKGKEFAATFDALLRNLTILEK